VGKKQQQLEHNNAKNRWSKCDIGNW